MTTVPSPKLPTPTGEPARDVLWGGLGVVLLFVLAVAVCLQNTVQLHWAAGQVAHTHDVLAALARFEQNVWEAQSRLWDDLEDMAPGMESSYPAMLGAMRDTAREIQVLTADNPTHQTAVQTLTQRIEPFAEMLRRVDETGRREGFSAARRLATSDEMRNSRGDLESLLHAMADQERQIRRTRLASIDRTYAIALSTLGIAGAVGLAALCLYLALLRSHLRAKARAAAAIEAQRQFLEATLTGIGDGVIVVDHAGHVTFLNPVAEELTGWKQAQAEGQPLETVFQIVNQTTRQPVENPAHRAMNEGRVIGLANHTVLVARDGVEHSIDDSASPIRSPDGAVTGAVLVFRDVTDARSAADALRDNERRKDEFLAMLGHELRNPLAGVVTGVQVLEMLKLGGDAGDMTAIIARQAAHMARIVDDLLDVSRIARGKLSLKQAPLDLGVLLRTIVRDYGSSHVIENCELCFEAPDFQACVHGDQTRLVQVVTNLIHNACKFCDGPNRVSISMRRGEREGDVAIVIRDCGVGMTPETLQRIFEPFSQADNSLERSRGGLGLGLALVKGVVELHGGRVQAESEGLAKGATFTVTLPMAPCPDDQPANGEKARADKRRVLLIDDRRDAIWPVQKFLEMEGHEVVVAYDGPQGLEQAVSHRPDIVLCDIGLAGSMNGYEVAQKLRATADLASVYLVAVTGYGQEEDRRTAQSAGFDYHLTKPVSRDQLYNVIAKLPRF